MFGKIFVPPLLLGGFPYLVYAFSTMTERSFQKLEQRVGVPPLVEFPEFPGDPNHALYNKFDPATQL